MAKSTAAWIVVTLLASSSATAESRCTLELDGVVHDFPHVYVIADETTFSDLDGVHPVTEHWLFCTVHPVEPPNPDDGDRLNTFRVELFSRVESNHVSVHLAHDLRVRRVHLTWRPFQGEPPHDIDLPVHFEGTFEGGRARGVLQTDSPVVQSPTPWYEKEASWRISAEIDTEILGGDS